MKLVSQSLILGARQLSHPRILKVLAKSVGVTLVIFACLGAALYMALDAAFAQAGLFAGFSGTFLATLVLTALAMWLLFRVIAIGVLQFFADEIVAAVEARHYPADCGRALPFKMDLANSARGMGRALLFNALALPIAVLLLFTAIGPGIVFLGVNAVLLGRELTDMCWLRLHSEPEAHTPVSRWERVMLGGAIAGLMVVPVANFLAPIIGAAAGTHLVHLKRAGIKPE